MKKNLLYLLLLFSGMLSAQTVNIPDAYLKNKLLSATPSNGIAKNNAGVAVKIDTNNNGEIEIAEAEAIWELYIMSPTIANLTQVTNFNELQYFTNLRKLTITGFGFQSNATSFDVSMLTNLIELNCNSNNFTSVNLSGLSNLQNLMICCNKLQSLNLTGLTALTDVTCRGNDLISLLLPVSSNLKNLDCAGNNLTSVNLSVCPALEELKLMDNNFAQMDFTQLIHLKKFDIAQNNLSGQLDISMLNELKYICISSNNISSVNFGNTSNLEVVQCAHNQLSVLDVSGLPLLYDLHCANNNIKFIDCGNSPDITTLRLANNPIEYINLKNGGPGPFWAYDAFTLTANGNNPVYICVNEDMEEGYVKNFFQSSNPNVVNNLIVSTYCSFTPGGNYNTIAGTVTFDGDNNGCSAADITVPNMKVSINDGTQTGATISALSGSYNFYTQAGSFTLTPQFENNWFTATPASSVISFANGNNNAATQNFCITPNGMHPDLEVVLIPIGGANPGFDTNYKIIYKNKGNQALSGSVTLNYDDAILDYVSSTPAYVTSATGQLSWNYSNLSPFESRTINVTLNLNGPMETPSVNIGNNLVHTVSITPSAVDETPMDNTFSLNQAVFGSFDPNDITCLEGDSVHPDKIGQYLHYNINFENTGNAPATFIVVKDMIDADDYEINSLQLMYASHNVETRIKDNRVEFLFDDINLAPLAEGNVLFKIKTKPTVAVNSTVMNKADIFFDYNWPIETNNANTTFAVLSSGEFVIDNSIKVYPNPSKGVINITAATSITSMQLYDVQGRLLQAGAVNDVTAQIDLSSKPSGIYFVKIGTEGGMKVEKIIKE